MSIRSGAGWALQARLLYLQPSILGFKRPCKTKLSKAQFGYAIALCVCGSMAGVKLGGRQRPTQAPAALSAEREYPPPRLAPSNGRQGLQKDTTSRDLSNAFRLARRRAWIVVLCVVLGAALAFAYSKTKQEEYTATAQVYFRNAQLDQEAAAFRSLTTSIRSRKRTQICGLRPCRASQQTRRRSWDMASLRPRSPGVSVSVRSAIPI